MAETLGNIVDKLLIKSIREFHIKKMIRSKKAKFSKRQLEGKLKILKKQKKLLFQEIEQFIVLALKGAVVLKDVKLKLYNESCVMNKIGNIKSLPAAIDGLAKKNLELWHLEDEARRKGVSLSHIGKAKIKIDLVNQQRNDLIDKMDSLLEHRLKTRRKKGANNAYV